MTADRFQTAVVGALAVLGLVAGLAIAASAPSEVRAPLVLAAALVCPGASVMGWFRRVEPALWWTSAIAVSCAVNILISMALVTAGLWNPAVAMTAMLWGSAAILSWCFAARQRPRLDDVIDDRLDGNPT